MAEFQRFISAARAHEIISAGGNVHVLDTRTPEEFAVDHVEGAANVRECFTYLMPNTKAEGVDELIATFARVFSEAGLNNSEDEAVVVYEDGMTTGFAQSCRTYFLLSLLGHKRVFVMNGGYEAWKRAGYLISTAPSTHAPANFKLDVQRQLIAGVDDVKAILAGESDYILLDDRDRAEWVGASSSPYGIDYTPRKGRIAGARWTEWYEYMEKDADGVWVMKSKESILAILARAGITKDTKVVCYCFKGSRASHTLMCLLECGLTGVRNYFGSWNEWSRDFSLPIDEAKLE